MPPVCRYFLKGNCRYGSNCRFEHPGEYSNGNTRPSGAGGFSFTKALEEVSTTGPSPQGFSFTRALQGVDNSPPFTQQYHNQAQNSSYFNQNQYSNYNNSSFGYDSSLYRQQYNQPSVSPSGFSFNQALTNANTSFNSPPQTLFGPPAPSQLFGTVDDIDMRGSEQAAFELAQEKESQLTQIELKAYQGDKFTFRLIPIRPPPQHLCY